MTAHGYLSGAGFVLVERSAKGEPGEGAHPRFGEDECHDSFLAGGRRGAKAGSPLRLGDREALGYIHRKPPKAST